MVLPAGQGQVPHPSIVPECFTINQLWNDRCTWPWGHCLLSELREWRLQTVLFEGDARNMWRDGPVCPAVDKELWRLGTRRLGCVLACYAPIGRERSRKTLLTCE
ncbi:uncharacterized protein TNCV_4673511 [Trichonephila clavipes]|nr:uncharacterized protein TNCV_4673511 [Trichonephila clavipes]